MEKDPETQVPSCGMELRSEDSLRGNKLARGPKNQGLRARSLGQAPAHFWKRPGGLQPGSVVRKVSRLLTITLCRCSVKTATDDT